MTTDRVRRWLGGVLGPLLALPVMARRPVQNRRFRYGLVGAGGLLAVWLTAAVLIHLVPERYTSQWTLILPGSGSGGSFALQNIGQASTNTASPYSSISRSPRVNYKEIAASRTVLDRAAELAGLQPDDFGAPRIKLIQQSSLMDFSVSGRTPDEARDKGRALVDALGMTLEQLRHNERELREAGMRAAMREYAGNLAQARRALLDHQAASGLVTTDQFGELVASVERLEQELIGIVAERDRVQSYLARLATSLNVDEAFASRAVILQADETFRALSVQYAAARARLSALNGNLGVNHPRVMTATAKIDAVAADLGRRASELLGTDRFDYRRLAMLDVNDNAGSLFRDVVVTTATLAGLKTKAASLTERLDELQARLTSRITGAATLADLDRDHRIAEAVFSSALARLDTGKADLFVSYPLIQRITEPSRPAAPDPRPVQYILAGAVAASLAFLTGMVLLWLRQPSIRV